jgi:DNA-binding beta-propeller fold protein YncE
MTGPVSSFHDVKNREIFIADGYGDGRRIIAFNSDSGKFTRMWGAYGRKPSDRETDEKEVYGRLSDSPAIPQTFGNPVHKVARAPDGRLCVCDRANNRVQEFELIPGGVRYLREVVIAPGTLVMGAVFDLAFTADGKYMYVADGSNLRVWTIDRETFAILGWTSSAPEKEGTDNISIHRSPLHRIAIEPNGDLLLARTVHGLQRLKYLGVH